MTLKLPTLNFCNMIIGATLVAMTLILVTLCSDAVTGKIFKYHLQYAEKQRVKAYISEIKKTSVLLDNLQYRLSFTCGANDVNELEKISYYSPQIAAIQLLTNDGKKCGDYSDTRKLYATPKRSIPVAPHVELISNKDNTETIVQYKKQVISGMLLVDIAEIPQNALISQLKDHHWLQIIEGNNLMLYSGSWKVSPSELFTNTTAANPNNLNKPVLSMPINSNKAWVKYYTSPHIIEAYGHYLRPYLLTAFILLSCLLFWMCYRYYHNASIIKFLIMNAIKQNSLLPYYQAIVDANTRTVCGFEVLIRWKTKSGKIILPDDFIPQCEKNGVITPLTFQLINTVATDIKKLEKMHDYDQPLPYYFSINISASVLQDRKLVEITKQALRRYKLAPHNIAFELTERSPIEDMDLASQICQELQDLGIQLKLDDVGNGYCDFLALQKLQATTIKIDKVFINDLDCRAKNTIVNSLAAFAEKAEIEVIAEGVETSAQAACLLSIGIRYHQGYLYSKPKPLQEICLKYPSILQ